MKDLFLDTNNKTCIKTRSISSTTQMFQSSFTSFEDFLYGDAKRDTFWFGFETI